MNKSNAQPPHPGEILRMNFMEPCGLSATALAKALNVTPPRINDILLKRRGISGDTALRLARYFGGDPRDWLVLQAEYDLHVAEIAGGKTVEREVKPRASPIGKAAGRDAR
jgi:addiction module HigA family antidote